MDRAQQVNGAISARHAAQEEFMALRGLIRGNGTAAFGAFETLAPPRENAC
jgi:hypothetical protein